MATLERLQGVSTKPPFEEVVEHFGVMVLRVCTAVVGPLDAQDAWSETFLAALTAYPGLTADANVEAWLVTIAHRKAIDATRRASRAIPMAEVPEQRAARPPEERDLDLSRALALLTDHQRVAVVSHYIGGLPYREVAEVLGSSTEAARRAAADGIARLRTMRGALR